MDSMISLQYPLWFTGICVLLGLIFAIILYFRDRTFKDAEKSQRRMLPFMALFRFLGITSIALLILGPLLKKKFEQVQKPYVVIAQDNSESIANSFEDGDSTNFANNLDALVEQLGEEVEVKRFVFDEKLLDQEHADYTGKITNLSATIEDIYNRFSHQNVGAIVLATDGIYNEGSNPAYSGIKMDIPVYTVALGDTTPARDIKVDKVLHNSIAYRGDKFTIRADVSAFNAKGNKTILNVYSGKGTSNKVFTKSLTIDKERFFASQDIILEAGQVGVREYTISVSQISDEISTVNNYQKIYVEILEGKQKILVLANNPHPDISALKQSIERNKNYETTTQYINKFDGNTKDYNLAILHGLPSSKNDVSTLASKLKAANIPVWYIVTSTTAMNSLDQIQDLIKISGTNNSVNDVQPLSVGGFNLFTFDDGFLQKMEEFPPLKVPYGEYTAAPTAQVFLKQKIGSVDTDYPLFALQQSSNYKTAILCGEGIWRWKMADYMKSQNHETVHEMVSKVVQYMAVKNDKRQFRVMLAQNIYNENDNITFDGELYNDSYELINEPEARLKVIDQEGKEYPYTFSKTANAYSLEVGKLPVGEYRFIGRTIYNGKELKSTGNFTVRALQLEAMQTTADHNMLRLLSQNYGGEMVKQDNISALAEKIKNAGSLTPELYTTYKAEPIINLKYLFFAILAFLSFEWFMRKYSGGY